MQIAILGLGKIGRVVAEKLMLDGHEVVVWSRKRDDLEQYRVEKAELVVRQKLHLSHSVEMLQDLLIKPRIFCIILPPGDETETVSQDIFNIAEVGDVVIDAGESNFKDTQRRSKQFEQKGVKYVGVGILGGVLGLENGFSLMVGGNKEGYTYITPLLESLAKPNGSHTYLGIEGAGHFVKMVHDAVAVVMTQAIAEGVGVLAKSEYKFNIVDIASAWQRGSMVNGYILQLIAKDLLHDGAIFQTKALLSSLDAVKGVVELGREHHVPIELLEKVTEFRSRSQFDRLVQETVAAKLIAAVEKDYTGEEAKKPEEKPQ